MENLLAMELERGCEFANQLQGLIFRSGDQEDKAFTTSSTEDLAAKVLNSFTNALSLFNNHHHVPADSSPSSFFYLPANSDESHQSPKSSKTRSPSSIKDQRRRSSKKRKVIQTWEEDSKMSPKEDGHAWRKYGQKTILDYKHPRNYFRCTHKYEQGCKATKQVQQIHDDPPLYRTTYFGHHTCTNFLNPQIFLDDSHDLNSTSACILSFDNNHNNNHSITTNFDQKVKTQQQNHLFLSPSFSLFPSSAGSVKNEDHHCHNIKQEMNINYINDYIDVDVPPSCSSNDFLVSPDEEEAVDLPFGYDDDQVADVFNSLVLEDPLFEMVFDH